MADMAHGVSTQGGDSAVGSMMGVGMGLSMGMATGGAFGQMAQNAFQGVQGQPGQQYPPQQGQPGYQQYPPQQGQPGYQQYPPQPGQPGYQQYPPQPGQPGYQQYPIIRSHSYGIKITALPKELGYASFSEAIVGNSYSNSQTVAIDPVVDHVTDGEHFLNITEGNGTTILYQAPVGGGKKVIPFTYKNGDGTGIDDADFLVKWLEHDGITNDGTVNPEVNYNTTTGEGTIEINLSSITNTLKKGTIQIQDIQYGLSRFIKNFHTIGPAA